MKRMMMIGLLMMTGHFAFSQRWVNNDPSYSVNNYKHPNKAAYAREHGLDRLTTLEAVSVTRNDNYKQPYSATKSTQKYAIAASEHKQRPNSSYKHPYGL